LRGCFPKSAWVNLEGYRFGSENRLQGTNCASAPIAVFQIELLEKGSRNLEKNSKSGHRTLENKTFIKSIYAQRDLSRQAVAGARFKLLRSSRNAIPFCPILIIVLTMVPVDLNSIDDSHDFERCQVAVGIVL